MCLRDRTHADQEPKDAEVPNHASPKKCWHRAHHRDRDTSEKPKAPTRPDTRRSRKRESKSPDKSWVNQGMKQETQRDQATSGSKLETRNERKTAGSERARAWRSKVGRPDESEPGSAGRPRRREASRSAMVRQCAVRSLCTRHAVVLHPIGSYRPRLGRRREARPPEMWSECQNWLGLATGSVRDDERRHCKWRVGRGRQRRGSKRAGQELGLADGLWEEGDSSANEASFLATRVRLWDLEGGM